MANIRPNPWNPNKQSDFIYEKERNSIKTFGFLDPILVREIEGAFEIIDGEHRWRAAQDEGYDELPCNNLGPIEDEIAQQLTVIMNETRGRADELKLGKLIADLQKKIPLEEILKNLPYQKDELDHFVALSAIDWDKVDASLGKGHQGSGEPWMEFKIVLPESLYNQWVDQLNRIHAALGHKQKKIEIAQKVAALECLIQHIAQIPDDQII